MLKLRSIKTQLIIYLAGSAVFLSIRDRDLVFLTALIIAVISSLIAESTTLFFKKKLFEITESSIITGLIIGFVLSSNLAWRVIVAASLIAIISKHLIRFQNKPIFNPAAFGIFLAVVLFNVSTQWRGAYLWYLLLPAGMYFIYKIRKIEIIIGYVLVFICLFGIQAFWQKNSIWHILGYLNYFYIFIMIIEPKTTPVKPALKFLFGSGIAVLIFILTKLPGRFDSELVSLLIMNPAAYALAQIF
ncbi:MAG: RnfABCDGE type electron transport complex subunit D [Candidatus Omnitrophota bacterium]